MKKLHAILALLLAALMLFSLAACAARKDVPPADKGEEEKNSAPAEPEKKEEPDPAEPEEKEEESEPQPAEPEEKEGEPEPEPAEPEEKEGEPDPQPAEPEEKEEESEPQPAEPEEKEEEPDPQPAEPEEKEEEKEPEPETIIPEAPSMSGDITGSFSSNTGTSMNLIVKWAATRANDDSYDVTLQYFIKSYDFFVGPRFDNQLILHTAAGDKTSSFSTAQISKPSSVLNETYLGQSSVSLSSEEMSAGIDASVIWNFKGSYSGQPFPTVEASGVIASN